MISARLRATPSRNMNWPRLPSHWKSTASARKTTNSTTPRAITRGICIEIQEIAGLKSALVTREE